ncbi:unnamed protein product [Bursaphelenchus xylophilus]|nr:unnamed protein product [Bursaphelenchus xylophilus]CAG9111254.1 unnamed protein product [Bursaphelenchus xylophilus]
MNQRIAIGLVLLATCIIKINSAPIPGQTYQLTPSDPFVQELAEHATRQIQLRDGGDKQILFLNVEKAEATIDENGRSYEVRFQAGLTNCFLGEECDEWNVEDKNLYLASIFVPEQGGQVEYDINVVPLKNIPWGGGEASGYGCKSMACGIE